MTAERAGPDLEVIRALEEAGAAERRAMIEETERLETYPGERHAQELLERLIREPAPGAAKRERRAVLPLLAAAAAVVLVLLGYRLLSSGRSEAPEDYLVGPGGLELLSPIGETGEYGTFRWEHELPAGGWFELRVFEDDGRTGAELHVIETEETTWTPDQPLPARIRWEVRAFGPSREHVGSASARSSLSSP